MRQRVRALILPLRHMKCDMMTQAVGVSAGCEGCVAAAQLLCTNTSSQACLGCLSQSKGDILGLSTCGTVMCTRSESELSSYWQFIVVVY